ncbi:hypothetical protein G6F46_006926 [Rhizopus delemar]|uniref:Cytochrome P450 n=2 Tax=Rhizopus TaxID=4842 RepID=A0A9P6ZC20_9FUNG|nr:hypothetical protein G6F55_004784 [Rhizopus delemar]KAG1545821.1 hypothetical protein G6F51_005243 [Rhizopus arrhizus]KAG1496686.1 hypothetical protein G6F54_006302 [Rhizopus delemar]KAG1526126.1 hypothetical protein G6F52_002718 [Rhizopus delemar]KAG1554242.1 hypothetical protein G6F49_008123 [Rhizopus delemar]
MTSILTIAFGDICSFEPEDPTLHKAFNLTERASKALSPGDQIREFFPILQILWPAEKARYFQLRDDIVKFYETLLNRFKAQKSTQDCFVKEIMKENELNDLQIIYFIALFVGAGSDTTASTIEWTIAYLANHPEVQDLAYNEIKEEVGLDRLPQSYDEPNLPFVQCIILETLRIRPPAPTAIPHATSEDDVYKGWHIPKNAVILMNLFAIHNNPLRFPNPSQFQPERHLEYVQESLRHHKFSQVIEDRPHLGFSTGRRVCVGIHLAERKLFMAISMLLACFKIERISEDLIDVNTHKDIHGVTWAIPHYKIQLVPRHDKVATFFR